MLRDCHEQLVMREDWVLLDLAVPLDAVEADRNPVRERKVHRLVEVEAMVEAGVVRARERDDELVWSLVDGVHSAAVLLEMTGAHERDELEQKVGLLIEQLRSGSLHRGFELLVILSRNAVPRLRISEVMVVDPVYNVDASSTLLRQLEAVAPRSVTYEYV